MESKPRKPREKSKDQIFRETVRPWYRIHSVDIPRLEGRIEAMRVAGEVALNDIEAKYGHMVTPDAPVRMMFRDDVLEMYRDEAGVFGIRIVGKEPEVETDTDVTPPVAEVPEDEEDEEGSELPF